MQPPADARKHPRRPAALAVTLALEGGGRVTSATADVGMGGFGLPVAAPPPVGTRLVAELRVGEGAGAVTVRSPGIVVWVRGGEAGVAFTGTDAENTRRLRDLFLYNPLDSAWD
jgi:hypothetical protein